MRSTDFTKFTEFPILSAGLIRVFRAIRGLHFVELSYLPLKLTALGLRSVQRFMNMAHHFGRRGQGLIPLVFPFGRARLAGLFAQVDVGLELAHELVDIAAHVVKVHFGVQKRAIRADDECPPQIQAGVFVIHPKHAG